MSQASLRVTVLAGGPSAEREVSLESGRAVADALRRRGHQVAVADIAPDNLSALDAPADVVFPALHGPFGEDGQLQGILERRRIPFVGSGADASAIAMDKVASKRCAIELGIRTSDFEVLEPGQQPTLVPPVVVKPIDQGSSVGVQIVREEAALRAAVDAATRRFKRAMVERFVEGDEITVGIVENRPLPPICVRPKSAFYDYHAKYHDDRTEYLFDTGLSAAALASVSRDSLRLFERLGCRHLGRVDWIVDRAGVPHFLEINTLPGFTAHSLTPMAAARAGVPFDQLVDQLVRMALKDRG